MPDHTTFFCLDIFFPLWPWENFDLQPQAALLKANTQFSFSCLRALCVLSVVVEFAASDEHPAFICKIVFAIVDISDILHKRFFFPVWCYQYRGTPVIWHEQGGPELGVLMLRGAYLLLPWSQRSAENHAPSPPRAHRGLNKPSQIFSTSPLLYVCKINQKVWYFLSFNPLQFCHSQDILTIVK